MGKSFKGFSKALSIILAAAMIFGSVPTSAYGAELIADESEDILISNDAVAEESSDALVTDDASASEEKSSSLIDTQTEADLAAAPEENTAGEEEIGADQLATQRVINLTATGGVATTPAAVVSTPTTLGSSQIGAGSAGPNIVTRYGTAITNATFEAAATTGTLTDASFKLATIKKNAEGENAYEVSAVDTAIANKNITGADGFNSMVDIVDANGDNPAGLTGLKGETSGCVYTLSGTPKKVVNDIFYLIISDATAETTDWSKADDIYHKILINIQGVATSGVTASPNRLAGGTKIFFGSGTDANITSTSAKEGYTVSKVKDSESTKDNVVPVELSVSATIPLADSDYVSVAIEPYDSHPESTNTNTLVKSGNASKNAFTITPAKSTNKVSTGIPAKFTVAPATGLAVKDPAGTMYKAKLVITSAVFAKKTFDLEFKVTSGIAIKSVVAHGGNEVAVAGDVYNLGTLKVGETIDDVAITIEGASGTVNFTADTASTKTTTDGNQTMKPLPTGLTADTSTPGVYKIGGMITPAANDYVGTTKYFSLVATDANSGVATAERFFKYTIAPADVDVYIIKGAYDADKATKFNANGADTAFSWYGPTGATLTDEYATVYIDNKSGVDLTFTGDLTNNTNEFVFDPTTVSSEGKFVAKNSHDTFRIVPKATSGTAGFTLTAPGAGSRTTGASGLIYGQNANLKITKPAADKTLIGTAHVGQAFSYTFEATNATAGTSGVTWSITGIDENNGTSVSETELKNDFGLTFNNGTLSGTLKKVAAGVPATATYGTHSAISKGLGLTIKASNGIGTYDQTTHVVIGTDLAAKGLTFTAGGKEIKAGENYKFADANIDSLDDVEVEIGVTNNTLVELSGVASGATATWTVTKTNPSATTDNGEFVAVYDADDEIKDAALAANGFKLAPSESASFKLVANPSKIKALGAGTYTVSLTIGDGSTKVTDQSFTATLTVKDAPVISVTNFASGFVVGTVPATSVQYETVYANPNSGVSSVDTAYQTGDASDRTLYKYELVSGSIPGLKLNEKGYWEADGASGGPTTAGVYEVTVRATTTKLPQDVSSTVTHEIEVAGNAVLQFKNPDAPSTVWTGKTYILPGVVTGYSGNEEALGVLIGETGNAEDATGVTVSIADADDDRTSAADLEDKIKNPDNPYKNSSTYIQIGTLESTTIEKNTNTLLYVKTVAGAPAGLYKATITVKGTNASEKKFTVALPVVDKLTITANDFAGKVGQTLAANNGNFVLTAEGGYADQTITWKENGTTVDAAKKFYITTSGTAGGKADGTGNSINTGLMLPTEGSAIGAADSQGLKVSVQSGNGTSDYINAAGTYTVSVGASVPAISYSNMITQSGSAGSYTYTNNEIYGKIANILLRNVDVNGDYNIVGGNIIPTQTAENKTFTLTLSKSNDPQVTDLQIGAGAKASLDGGKTIAGTVTGKSMTNAYSSISQFVYDPVAVGYTNTAQALKVTVTGGKGTILTAKPTLASTNNKIGDNFEITAVTNSGGSAVTPDGNGNYLIDTTTNGGTIFVITPNPGLPKGTYSDTFVLKGDNVEDINLAFSFVVADRSYTATIDNNISPNETDAATLAKRIEYAKDMTEGTGTTPIEVKAIEAGTAPSGGDAITVAIRNTGNTALNGITVVEASKSGNTYVVTPAGSSMITLTATTTVLNPDNTGAGANTGLLPGNVATFTVDNKNAAKADTTAYVDIAYKDHLGNDKEIILPVKVVRYNSAVATVTVTPGTTDGSEVALETVPESYSAESAAKTFTVKNTGSGASETLIGVGVAFSGTDAAKFRAVVPADNKIEAGKQLEVTILPVENLPAGTYTATAAFTADNIKQDIKRTIKFEVEASETYTANKITTSGMFTRNNAGVAVANTSIEASMATRLYNSIFFGLTVASDYVSAGTSTLVQNASSTHVFNLDLDKDGKDDVEAAFSGTGENVVSPTQLVSVSGATIKLLPTNTVKVASKTIALVDTEQTAAKEGLGQTGSGHNAKFFKEITFNLYGIVSYTAGLFAEKTADLQAFNSDIEVGGTEAAGTKRAGQANTSITTLVPIGSAVGSVFKDAKLPTPVIDTAFLNWQDAANAKVESSTIVKKDIVATVKDSGAFQYATSTNDIEGDVDGVKWTWTNDNGNIDAVITLTDTTGKYDEASKVEFNKDSKAPVANKAAWDLLATADKKLPFALTGVSVVDNGSQPATCTKGSRKELKATINVQVAAPGSSWVAATKSTWGTQGTDYVVYTSTYSLDEADDKLGHTLQDAVVVWNDKNGDGKYTKDEVEVTRTCSVCSEKIALTVTAVNEAMSVEPTCTKDGKATYTVVYTDVDKFGNPTTSVTDTKNVKESVVKALGHNYKLEVEWAADHKTASKATLVCDRCNEDETGHTVDVTASVTYDLKMDPVSGEILSNQAIYAAGTKDEVKSEVWMSHTEHSWTFGGFTWASDLKSATGSFICEVGKETKPATVTMSDKTNGKDPAKQVTEWTAKVTADPDGKTLVKAITESKYVWTATGLEATREDFIKALGEGLVVEGLEDEYPFTGKPIKPAFTVIDNATEQVLVEKTDYTVKFTNNKKLNDTATITITGKGNYDKQTITRQFKIVDPLKDEDLSDYAQTVKGVKASKDTLVYDGGAKYPSTLEIKTEAGVMTATLNSSGDGYDLPDGAKNVMITVTNNVNKGSGIVAVTGADKKTKTATFSIKAADLGAIGSAITVSPDEAAYAKAGAKAAVAVTFSSEAGSFDLVEGRDYTLTWSYANKKNAGDNAGSVVVKGKNNFKGKTAAVPFNIAKLALAEDNIIVDVAEKVKVKSLKVKVYDGNGDEISNKFYSIVKVEKDSETLSPDYKLAAGDEITVTVNGDGNNVEDTEVSVDVKVGAKLSSAKFKTASVTKQYTGEPVELDDEDLAKITASVKINKVDTPLVAGEDYEVVGYQKNIKAGNMTVIVRGIGDKVSGFGKFKVKITAKPVKDADK